MTRSPEIPQSDALWLQLVAIAGGEPAGGLLEVRYRRPGGRMGQVFHEASRPRALVEPIEWMSARSDVYVGCAPRRNRHGGERAIERAWVLWVDLDGDGAPDGLGAFTPAPTIIVRSGTGENRHAYWSLRRPLTPAQVRQANRRLAHALAGDQRSTDPARVLRPAGTLNYKHPIPRPVVCERLELDSYLPCEVVGHLPDPPTPEPRKRAPGRPAPPPRDALAGIAPTTYVEALTGRPIGRDGKIACPFHEDRTPSLHVYDDPDRGWACFGCGRGGTLIDFGAALYGLEPRGREYHEIRRRLAEDLLRGAA